MDEQRNHWISELKKFSVCQLADALGPSCPIETSIRPIDPCFRICGLALTVECAPGDNLTVHHALHLARPGDALIVGGPSNSPGALWGELMSISAASKCLAGTIIDGPVRDPIEIQKLGYPVFCREFSPHRAAKEAYGRVNVPSRIGKISVQPQDFVLADANGIICIEMARVQEAVQLASEVMHKERNIRDQIRRGRTIFEILDLERHIAADRQQGTMPSRSS